MIKSKKDYYYYLEADRIALSIPKQKSLPHKTRILNYIFKDYVWEFQKTLRRLEYLKNKEKNIFDKITYFFVYKKYRKLSNELGLRIFPNVFGPGLAIVHYGTILVGPTVKIGSNCRIHSGVNIGTDAGYSDAAPILGDNIYIGPGAKLFGNIKIANNTIVGANAVVTKSFEKENTFIGGIPAKLIAENREIDDVLIRATNIIELGLNTKDLSGLTSLEIKKIVLDKNSNGK